MRRYFALIGEDNGHGAAADTTGHENFFPQVRWKQLLPDDPQPLPGWRLPPGGNLQLRVLAAIQTQTSALRAWEAKGKLGCREAQATVRRLRAFIDEDVDISYRVISDMTEEDGLQFIGELLLAIHGWEAGGGARHRRLGWHP